MDIFFTFLSKPSDVFPVSTITTTDAGDRVMFSVFDTVEKCVTTRLQIFVYFYKMLLKTIERKEKHSYSALNINCIKLRSPVETRVSVRIHLSLHILVLSPFQFLQIHSSIFTDRSFFYMQ